MGGVIIKEQDFIHFVRVYKHDFLNHLQVIQGYLQLKKPEQALRYLKEAIMEIESHGSIMKLKLASVAFWLLLQELEHKELGITVHLESNSTFSASLNQEEEILSFLKCLVGVITVELGKLPYEHREWGLSFTGQDGLKLIFTLPKKGETDWERVFKDKFSLLKDLQFTTQSSYEGKNFICQVELKVS